MVFRLRIIIFLYFYYFFVPNGRLHVYGYETKQFVGLEKSNQTIQYPTNEHEIQALIQHAYQHGSTIVRVIGSGHSYNKAIYDGQDMDPKEKLTVISLEEHHGVTIDKKNNVAIVKAGTVIGPNPEVDNKNIEESLVGILNQHGYAIPDLAGITRQTIAGFLSTGAAGGSLSYSFYDVLVGVRLIDGKGTIHDISKKDSKFYAAGISMGLFGIITSVNISLTTKSYYIKGSETVSLITPPSSNASIGCPIDMFGDGSRLYPSLTKFLKNGPDYSRIFWYPVKGCDRSVIWEASRYDRKPIPPIVPYPEPVDANLTAEALQVADILMAVNTLAEDTEEFYSFLCSILDQGEPFGKRKFFDIYYNSLPMDNYADYKVLRYSFTELWVPIEKTKVVANTLRNYYSTHGVDAISNNPFEIYASGKSQFWLSPAYNADVVRFGWLWFDNNPIGTARNFFQQFWDLLEPFDYRYHWGKYLPDDYNGQRLHKLYPMLKKWLEIRSEMDPRQIFVTLYWRKIFSIEKLKS